MAVPKKDVEKLSEQEMEQIRLAEDAIDEQLKKDYAGEKMVFPIKMSSRCKRELRQRYEIAGWKVTFSAHPSDVYADLFELS